MTEALAALGPEAVQEFLLDAEAIQKGSVVAVGASGEVSRGLYQGHSVAIKILKRSGSPQSCTVDWKELRREIGAMVTCRGCPQLLQFRGVFVDSNGKVGVVTRYMEGGTLRSFIQRRRGQPLALAKILRLAQDIALGLEGLHGAGIIHRDLKSENVLLDAQGSAVLCDFGLSRPQGEGCDMTNEVGTYRWMAPEAFADTQWTVTHKSDIYSFGMILWELASLSLPFEGLNNMAAAIAVGMKGERPPIPGHCDTRLRNLIQRCWDSNPDHRPDVHELLHCLRLLASSA